jgi:hypothetical protein
MPAAIISISVRQVTITVTPRSGAAIHLNTSRRAQISVAARGVAGPPGAITDHIHTQGSPASIWTVNHNLGRKPLVAVFSPGAVEVEAEIIHHSDNHLSVLFATATTGSARCI